MFQSEKMIKGKRISVWVAVAALSLCSTAFSQGRSVSEASFDTDFPVAWQLAAVPVEGQVVQASAKDILLPGHRLKVHAINHSARGSVYVLEQPQEGGRISIRFDEPVALNPPLKLGSWVQVGEAPEGVLLMADGAIMAFVSNALMGGKP
jgi:hypothetical protein